MVEVVRQEDSSGHWLVLDGVHTVICGRWPFLRCLLPTSGGNPSLHFLYGNFNWACVVALQCRNSSLEIPQSACVDQPNFDLSHHFFNSICAQAFSLRHLRRIHEPVIIRWHLCRFSHERNKGEVPRRVP